MKPKLKKLIMSNVLAKSLLLISVANVLPLSRTVLGQAPAAAPAPAANPNRVAGTITAVGTGVLTVKTDAGTERKVTVPDGIKMQRIAPGETSLTNAATIQFADFTVGDRVLVRLAPNPATDPVTAISIVDIRQQDLAQKQQKERDEWQRNGVGGLVKSVDAGTGIVVITSGAGPALKTITLRTSPTTVLRRYADNSVSFDQAKPAPLEVIHAGDQLRARGTKNADGTEVTAEEVVSGSFRNISGTIISVSQSAMTLTLKDLSTKQTVTVHVGPEAQMRKLPEAMAKRLASFTKPADTKPAEGAATGSASSPAASSTTGATTPSTPVQGQTPSQHLDGTQHGSRGADSMSGQGSTVGSPATSASGASRAAYGSDPQQMLSRAPAIHLSDLQKGDAIMLVSTQGTTDVTAVTLLAGVEPLLEAPASTQSMLLSSWNMSSGGAEAAQ
jgi:hypothetical protein